MITTLQILCLATVPIVATLTFQGVFIETWLEVYRPITKVHP